MLEYEYQKLIYMRPLPSDFLLSMDVIEDFKDEEEMLQTFTVAYCHYLEGTLKPAHRKMLDSYGDWKKYLCINVNTEIMDLMFEVVKNKLDNP